MTWYYVRSHADGTGTRTSGGFATQQTGDWDTTFTATTDYYASVKAALAGQTLVAGDVVCVSDIHYINLASSTTIALPQGCRIISVDDTDIDSYKAGGHEYSSNYISFSRIQPPEGTLSDGVDWSSGQSLNIGSGYAQSSAFSNCTLACGESGPSTSDKITISGDGATAELYNVILAPSDIANATIFSPSAGAEIRMYGGSVSLNTNKPAYLVGDFGNGGSRLLLDSVDLTNMASGFEIVDSVNYTADYFGITLRNCKLPSSWTLGETVTQGGYILLENCDNGTNGLSAFRNFWGSYISSTSVYDSGADTVDGGNQSLEVTTYTYAHNHTPLRFKLGSVYADFSTAKTITVQVVHDAQGSGTGSRFTTAEAWIEIDRPNSTDPGRLLESTRTLADFEIATTNAASTNTWIGTSMTSETKEKIELTTTSGGGEGWVDVYVCIGVASIGANDLFVSHDIEVA